MRKTIPSLEHLPATMRTSEAIFAPIGVYDSGIGGLSVLRALREALPAESFVYVADNAHAPYGDRPAAFIETRATHISQFLVGCGVKALVLACNTASVVAAQHLRKLHGLPIVAMEPAIKPATQLTRSKVVLVLATTNTIHSPAVARLCHAYGQEVKVIP
ncbi:MAG: aspartate/glutamate racemase family protein, partial [Methylovulum sp.]|nr:aspartate/glutamate racemase family protein [Methylovulum sp.]